MKSLKILAVSERGEQVLRADVKKNFGPLKKASFRMVGIGVDIEEKPYSITFNFISEKLQGALKPENFKGMIEENLAELEKNIDYVVKEE